MTSLTPSAFYFLFFAAISCLVPFMALFYRSLGLTGSQIGLLTGITPLITLVAAPFWTGLADSTRRHKLVMAGLIAGTVAAALLILQMDAFFWLLLVVSVYSFLQAPVASLSDSATMSMLGENRDRYGRVRLWGTLGWGVVAPAAGLVIQRTSLDWAFYLFAGFMGATLIVSLWFAFPRASQSVPFAEGMRTLLRNRRWMFFLAMVFLCGIGTSTVSSYLFVFMEDLQASKTLMGIALTIATVSELPVMFFANRLLRRFNPRGVLLLALVTVAVRVLLYSLSGAAWQVLLIQLLHGLTFPVIWVAGVSYADEIAPPGLKASAQGMFGGTLMGFGAAVGSLLGGVLLQQVGSAGMYRVTGFVVLAGMLFILASERIFAGETL
jgi:PPP family 3-phenylpropionic acid transporter